MEKLVQQVKNFWNDEVGATAVEYGLMVALIAAFIITSVTLLRDQVAAAFTAVATAIQTALGA